MTGGASQITFARALLMHPSRSGECAVLSFTAPKHDHHRISAPFYAMGGYGCGTVVKVFVLHNSVGSPGNLVRGSGGPLYHSFNFGVPLITAGVRIDFAVDMNGSVNCDSTGLYALVEWH